MSLPAVSKHIKVLEGARLVKRTRRGSYYFLRLDAAAMKRADERRIDKGGRHEDPRARREALT